MNANNATPAEIFTISADIIKAEHTLIAGTTGAGKSVLINTFLTDCHGAYAAGQINFVYIDLKRVELIQWEPLPHCIYYADDEQKAVYILYKMVELMQYRFDRMRAERLKKSTEPHIFIVIDELAILTDAAPEAMPLLIKIGRLSRAVNIHIVAATQAPNRKTLTGALHQNFTCCIGLRCRSSIESRQIIGVAGCEKLPEYGYGIQWDRHGYKNINIPLTDQTKTDKIIKYYMEG